MDAVATQSVTLDSLQAQQDAFVAIASFTILCWDHAITFADEVDLMWCKRKGPLGYLFLLNRYITPLGFVVNIVALSFFPNWSTERCRNFVRYQGAMATFGVSIAELIMLMRVHALYRDRKLVVAVPGILLLAWVALEVCLMALGKLVPHAQQIHSCREVYDLPPALSATRAWLPLAYDTAIFIMTLWRTWPSDRSGATSPIFQIFQSDGILYFIVTCSANIVLTAMIVRAPPGLKGIAAKLVFLLTVVMTSRVTLSLKKQVNSPCNQYQSCFIYPPTPTVLKSAPGHQQMSRKLFVDNPKLQLPRSTNAIPSVSIDSDPTDDVQSFGSVDVESLRSCHVSITLEGSF